MTRRAGIVAVHSLDHVAFDVPDVAEARRFYEAFGLHVTGDAAAVAVHAHGDPRPWLVIGQASGPRKQLRHVAFGAYAEDLPALATRLDARGERLPTSTADRLVYAAPHGVTVQVRAAPKRTLDAREAFPARPPRARAAPLRSQKWLVRPTRVSHALLFCPDLPAAIAFYTEALGLRLSDDAGPVAFLHAPHGSDHHVLAFAAAPSSGLHHVAWAVSSFDDVGLGAMQMADHGYTRGWGVGRHVLGSNYFHYVRDPWGSYCEYSFDIDYVPDDGTWRASTQTPDNGFYLWGPTVPDDFTHNYEREDSRG